MSTRGLWGFQIDGTTKVTYNHFDSYPDALGDHLVRSLNWLLANTSLASIRLAAQQLEMLDTDSVPTEEQIEKLRKYADQAVGTRELTDWYVLLRKTQGNLMHTIDAGVMRDYFQFGFDSLFCEWGYVIDLDAEVFVVYRGFQKERPTEGLWAGDKPADWRTPTETGYQGIAPIKRLRFMPNGINLIDWNDFLVTAEVEA